MSTNTLTGTIPPSLANLVALTQLCDSGSPLFGTFPQAAPDAHSGRPYRSLSVNNLSGTFPTFLCSLTHLSWLYVVQLPLSKGL